MGTSSFTEFMQEGGWGMWPVLLLGFIALASATYYALRPQRLPLSFVAMLWLTLSVVIVHATLTDVAAVFHYLENPARAADGQMARVLMTGLKESSRPAALGGIFLTLVPLLAAAGVYRHNGRAPSTS